MQALHKTMVDRNDAVAVLAEYDALPRNSVPFPVRTPGSVQRAPGR